MKKLLLIPVVILLLTGCNKPAETQNVEQLETPQVATPEEQPEDAMEENTEILYNEDGSIDTSNWKTYTNEEYGFSVKYPENWNLNSEYKDGDHAISYYFGDKSKKYYFEGGEEDPVTITLNAKNNPQLILAEDLLKKWEDVYNVSTQVVTINGIKAYYFKGFGEGLLVSDIPNKAFEFSIVSSVMTTQEIQRELRPILQSMIRSINFF